jgi:hypothetical protein
MLGKKQELDTRPQDLPAKYGCGTTKLTTNNSLLILEFKQSWIQFLFERSFAPRAPTAGLTV